MEEKIEDNIEGIGRRERIREQLLDDDKETRRFLLLHRPCCYNYSFYSISCTYIHFKNTNSH